MTYSTHITELNEKGYSVTAPLYSEHEVAQILTCIENAEQNEKAFLKTNDLFAIRQLLKHVPKLNEVLFNKNLKALVSSISADTYFLTKAIYFDKPSNSNWFVAYHQDLSISVDRKVAVGGYTNWTFKKEQYGVQPPLNILQDTVTIRIHLDTTNENNGALKVIPASHLHGIIRMDSKEGLNFENEHICNVNEAFNFACLQQNNKRKTKTCYSFGIQQTKIALTPQLARTAYRKFHNITTTKNEKTNPHSTRSFCRLFLLFF